LRGNTLWNWLQLLLLPLLVPMAIVPALKPRALATVTRVEHDHQSGAAGARDRELGGTGSDQRREPAADHGATSPGSGETFPAASRAPARLARGLA
jgi:hypothetical protein